MSDEMPPHPHPWDTSNEEVNKKHKLPFEPEPLAAARARFGGALVDRYNAVEEWKRQEALRSGRKGGSGPAFLAPAQQRKHVFDMVDGFRICVSIDALTRANPRLYHLHVSASFDLDYFRQSFGVRPFPFCDKEGFENCIQDQLEDLDPSRHWSHPEDFYYSERGVLHYLYTL
jgi:hypothetical protein